MEASKGFAPKSPPWFAAVPFAGNRLWTPVSQDSVPVNNFSADFFL